MFQGFNQETLRLVLLSRQRYADFSLVRANVSSNGLSPIGMSSDEFRAKAVEENDLLVARKREVEEDGGVTEYVGFYQDSKGLLP